MASLETQALPTALYSAAQTRELDHTAIEKYGIPGMTLMERAGSAAFQCLRFGWPRARRIGVVCGPGNNGGDGYVLARLALEHGLTPLVISLVDPDVKLKGDAAAAWKAYSAAGGVLTPLDEAQLTAGDVLVDAIFGTGLERDIAAPYYEVIQAINGANRPVLALDIPSGLHADSGKVLGIAVTAHATISFIGLKAGLFTAQGPDYAGKVVFSDLGMAPDIYAGIEPHAMRLTLAELQGSLPPRRRDFHKGQCGHVLVVGGQVGMAGAAQMTGTAAYRSGAGLVTIATHPVHASFMSAAQPELMVQGIAEEAALQQLIAHSDVVALGPGLGVQSWGRGLMGKALDSAKPLVVDADALNLLAYEPVKRDNWILTPHPGEAARLLNTTAKAIQADRFAAARAITEKYGGVCVLKGCGTLIVGNTNATPALCDAGNPGMATGGMGDVLTGVIAALIGQGLTAWEAARLGVWVHASAADQAVHKYGETGLMAADVLAALPAQLNNCVTPMS